MAASDRYRLGSLTTEEPLTERTEGFPMSKHAPAIPGDWRVDGKVIVGRTESNIPHLPYGWDRTRTAHEVRREVLQAAAIAIRGGLTVVAVEAVDPMGQPSERWTRVVAEHRGEDPATRRAAARAAIAGMPRCPGWVIDPEGRPVPCLVCPDGLTQQEAVAAADTWMRRVTSGGWFSMDGDREAQDAARALYARSFCGARRGAPKTYRIEPGDDLGGMPADSGRHGATAEEVNRWLDTHEDVGTFVIVDEHDQLPACGYLFGLAGGAWGCECGRPECGVQPTEEAREGA